MYKLTITNNNDAYCIVLWKKFWFFYLPNEQFQMPKDASYVGKMQDLQKQYHITKDKIKFYL